jgi:HAE1 family hydrophobic/amphiphilic exporter-1
MLGFVILVGVVVNNAILLVHQALLNVREYGMTPRNAISESVRTRVRPIFMTAVTSVFGMLPLVVAPGAGSELYRGLGAVMVGGLTVATIFTLVLVPALFSLFVSARDGLAALIHGRPVVQPVPKAIAVAPPKSMVARHPEVAAPVRPAESISRSPEA